MSDGPVSRCPAHGEYSLHTGCFRCQESAILTQACRNVIPHEWPLTYEWVGPQAAASQAYYHLAGWPCGSVATRIREEYRRLLGEGQP